jgi:two-component system nitrate/nitrite response regulator NarL
VPVIKKICLLSSDEIFSAGLASVLKDAGFEIAGNFGSTSQIEKAGLASDFLAIVDFPKDEDRAEAVTAFKSLYPSSRVVVLSSEFALDSMMRCLKLGADGYILKSLKAPALIAALRLVTFGEKVVPSNLVDEHLSLATAPQSFAMVNNALERAGLSPRERDVLNHLAEGDANKVIARKLAVCEATVKVHVKAILRKLNVSNRTQAATWASAHGIGELPLS